MTDESDPMREALAEAKEALDSIRQFGSDTLSGRVDGPDDRAWQRGSVLEMRNRALAALAKIDAAMGWPPPPRSSCYHCPNHTQHEWREIRLRPADWTAAVQLDRELRAKDPHVFIHSDCVPLDQANLDDANGVLFGHCDSGHCFT